MLIVVSGHELAHALSLPPFLKLPLDATFAHDVHVLEDAHHDRKHVETGRHARHHEAPVERIVNDLAMKIWVATPVGVFEEEDAEDGEASHAEDHCNKNEDIPTLERWGEKGREGVTDERNSRERQTLPTL